VVRRVWAVPFLCRPGSRGLFLFFLWFFAAPLLVDRTFPLRPFRARLLLLFPDQDLKRAPSLAVQTLL